MVSNKGKELLVGWTSACFIPIEATKISKRSCCNCKETVKRSAWFAFSECFIQTLLCPNNEEERKLGVQKVLDIRRKGDDNTQFGYNSVRLCKTPSINTDADNLMDLIEW